MGKSFDHYAAMLSGDANDEAVTEPAAADIETPVHLHAVAGDHFSPESARRRDRKVRLPARRGADDRAEPGRGHKRAPSRIAATIRSSRTMMPRPRTWTSGSLDMVALGRTEAERPALNLDEHTLGPQGLEDVGLMVRADRPAHCEEHRVENLVERVGQLERPLVRFHQSQGLEQRHRFKLAALRDRAGGKEPAPLM